MSQIRCAWYFADQFIGEFASIEKSDNFTRQVSL